VKTAARKMTIIYLLPLLALSACAKGDPAPAQANTGSAAAQAAPAAIAALQPTPTSGDRFSSDCMPGNEPAYGVASVKEEVVIGKGQLSVTTKIFEKADCSDASLGIEWFQLYSLADVGAEPRDASRRVIKLQQQQALLAYFSSGEIAAISGGNGKSCDLSGWHSGVYQSIPSTNTCAYNLWPARNRSFLAVLMIQGKQLQIGLDEGAGAILLATDYVSVGALPRAFIKE
jgi:hypothetical protein